MRSLAAPFVLGTLILPALAGCGGDKPPSSVPAAPIVDDQGKATTVTCPGTAGCEKAEGELLAGAASKPITPTIETWQDANGNGKWDKGETFEDKNGNGKWDAVWLAGFGNGRAATAVHDEVWARALVLEQGDVSVGMVSLDCVGYFQQNVLAIRLAAEAAGLDFDHVLVSSTHVHESKDTMGLWGESISATGYDPAYTDHIVKQAVEALKEAKAGQKKAKLKVAQAERPELVNDTRLPIVIDQNITSLQFLDDAGSPFATAVFWGNHPEALGASNTLLTSDYPHYLRETIEAKWPETTAVFFNGLLGGLTTTIGIVGCPDAQGQETCKQGTWERAEYVGKGAAEAAIASLEGTGAKVDEAPALGVRRRGFLLQATNATLGFGVLAGLVPRTVYWADGTRVSDEDKATLLVSQLLAGEVMIATEVNGIHVGPVAIATVPGELYTELWLEKPGGGTYIEKPDGADFPDAEPETPIQSFLPEGSIKVMVNNANDALGYMIPSPQFDANAPHAYEPDGQYGEENSTGYLTAPLVTGEFKKMYEK
jgi:hypothetical protein